MLKNYMEDLVDLWLPRVFRDNPDKYADVCKCAACIAQIKREALNRCKPFYVTGKAGEVYGEYKLREMQYQTDLVVAIGSAIEAVSAKAHQTKETPPAGPQFESLANLRRRKRA